MASSNSFVKGDSAKKFNAWYTRIIVLKISGKNITHEFDHADRKNGITFSEYSIAIEILQNIEDTYPPSVITNRYGGWTDVKKRKCKKEKLVS